VCHVCNRRVRAKSVTHSIAHISRKYYNFKVGTLGQSVYEAEVVVEVKVTTM